jgi:ATP-dependent Clp protease ATP-binding subunit ClpA
MRFRREFLNCVEDTIMFYPLKHDNLLEIVQIQLQILQKRL